MRSISDQRGGIALVTALLAPLLISVAGFGLDFGYAFWINQRLNEAADAGALAAVSQSAANVAGGYGDTAVLQLYGSNVFQTNAQGLPVSASPNLTVSSNGTGGASSILTYTAAVPTFFSGIFGMNSINVSGSSKATGNPVTYINYYIVVDISQSMGIGSTATDMQNLYNRTLQYGNTGDGEPGCVFGCHVVGPDNNGQLQTYTNEYLAHNVSPTISLRIDAAVAAIKSIISAAQTAAGTAQNIKIGLYTMSDNPSTGVMLTTVAAPSNNYTNLATYAATIDLGGNTSSGIGDSNFTTEMTQFNAVVPTQGNGATASSPLNYVFVIADGVTDTYSSACTDTHCTAVFDSSLCTPLKAKSTVGVIYTTYLPVYYQNNSSAGLDPAYSALVAPFASQIAPAMQACATSANWYYQATDGPQIASAMAALFASSQSAVRITQ